VDWRNEEERNRFVQGYSDRSVKLSLTSVLCSSEVMWSYAFTMRYLIFVWWLNTGITLPCHWEFLFVYLFEFEGYGVLV